MPSGGGFISAVFKRILSQQFALARVHECTTTTCTDALLATIAEFQHAALDASLSLGMRQPTCKI
jgi:hypothetical protein